jgi:hypothetical protein
MFAVFANGSISVVTVRTIRLFVCLAASFRFPIGVRLTEILTANQLIRKENGVKYFALKMSTELQNVRAFSATVNISADCVMASRLDKQILRPVWRSKMDFIGIRAGM